LTMGPMRGVSDSTKSADPDMLAGSGLRSRLVSRDDTADTADAGAWALLQQTIASIQPLESESFAKRRAAAYLKRGSEATAGLWLLAPEIVYFFYRDQPFSDQVNHLEMLRLLDFGGMLL